MLARLMTGYLAANLGLGVVFPLLLLYPPRRGLTATQAAQLTGGLRADGVDLDSVTFETSDHVTLRGWMIWPEARPTTSPPPTGAAIILIHGRYANRRQTLPYTRFLAQAGFPVLLYDSRGQGQSGDHPCTYGFTERRDVEAAIGFLHANYGLDHVGLFGLSMGAATALQAAARSPSLRAVVADSAFASLRSVADHYGSIWGWLPRWVTWPGRVIGYPLAEEITDLPVSAIAPERDARQIHVPVLLIHGQTDWRVPPEHSQRIYQHLAGPRQLWLVPNAGHTEGYQVARSLYESRVIEFFRRSTR